MPILPAFHPTTPHNYGRRIFPAVDRLDRNQDAHLRRDLDQDAAPHNARLSAARSDAEAPFNWIRTVPCRPSSSIVHSGIEMARGVNSSTNAGAGFPGFVFPTISRFNLPPSR